MYLVDTNIMMNCPSVFLEDMTVSLKCIEELDKLKKIEGETGYKARRALKYIAARLSLTEGITTEDFGGNTVDDHLIRLAKKRGFTLLTNDLSLDIRARSMGVNSHSYIEKEKVYTGIKHLSLKFNENNHNDDLEKWMEEDCSSLKLFENQYVLIFKNDLNDESLYCILQHRNNRLYPIKRQFIENIYSKKILARNPEQECLLDLLYRDTSIILATGGWGKGKTYLLQNYALQEIEKERKNKIIYVPNNAYSENSRELGLLPGSVIEKELVHMGPLISSIGEDSVKKMMQESTLEIVPISIMRGRSYDNSIIYVSEAQNLTEEHVKLLVARCGESTKILFDGDIKQTDSYIFKNKNGLKLLTKLRESEEYAKFFGMVQLEKVERSKTAQAAEYLDSL